MGGEGEGEGGGEGGGGGGGEGEGEGEGGDGLLQIWSSSGEDRSSFKKEQGLMERSYSFMVA